MAEYCGKLDEPLGDDGLVALQKGILGTAALRLGVRRSPVFVGQATMREDVVHYIGPHFSALGDMLARLQAFEQATHGRESLARAAAIAFGFVYLHPMSDGNGRIHRFLINDTLLRDQAIPAGVTLPVSATITSVREFGHGYDRVLEVFSRPVMWRYDAAYRFGELTEYEDGAKSNLVFDAYDDANAAWRYRFGSSAKALVCSTPERAMLELCDGVSDAAGVYEVDALMQAMTTLRPQRVGLMLRHCRSIKAKRLFLALADRHRHAWLSHVPLEDVDLGRGKRALVPGGRLHPSYQITLPGDLDEHLA